MHNQPNSLVSDKIRVTLYQRHPYGANFSVERLFNVVRKALPGDIDITVAISRFVSRGVLGRIFNMVEASLRQGDVNHVTGDVQFLACLLCKKRTLLTILDLVTLYRLKGWRRKIVLFIWYWLPIKRAAVVSVISESTKRDLVRHVKVNPLKVRVVHCPVSTDFHLAAREFNASKPFILQVGTGLNKNVERVSKALKGIPCHLRIIGELTENQLSILHCCVIDYSSVSCIPDEQVVYEFRRCDFLVFASTYEGFGLPILEAQATGRPVVTSNIYSMPEVAGNAACLVDPFDVASIREGILKVIKNSLYREELVRLGIENVERFKPDIIARQYAEIYRGLFAASERSVEKYRE